MKHVTILSLALLMSIGLFAQQVEVRELPNFSAVSVSGSMDVIMEQGNETKVKIESSNIDPDKIITEVVGGTLKIYLEKMNMYPRNVKIRMQVMYKSIHNIRGSGSGDIVVLNLIKGDKCSISCSGSGDFTSKSKIEAGSLSIRNSGSGDIDLNVINAKSVEASFSGSGDGSYNTINADRISLTGSGSTDSKVNAGNVSVANYKTSGSGSIMALGLKADRVTARTSGSGRVSCNANEELNAYTSGSGGIRYKGTAKVKTMKVSGSGKLQKVN